MNGLDRICYQFVDFFKKKNIKIEQGNVPVACESISATKLKVVVCSNTFFKSLPSDRYQNVFLVLRQGIMVESHEENHDLKALEVTRLIVSDMDNDNKDTMLSYDRNSDKFVVDQTSEDDIPSILKGMPCQAIIQSLEEFDGSKNSLFSLSKYKISVSEPDSQRLWDYNQVDTEYLIVIKEDLFYSLQQNSQIVGNSEMQVAINNYQDIKENKCFYRKICGKKIIKTNKHIQECSVKLSEFKKDRIKIFKGVVYALLFVSLVAMIVLVIFMSMSYCVGSEYIVFCVFFKIKMSLITFGLIFGMGLSFVLLLSIFFMYLVVLKVNENQKKVTNDEMDLNIIL